MHNARNKVSWHRAACQVSRSQLCSLMRPKPVFTNRARPVPSRWPLLCSWTTCCDPDCAAVQPIHWDGQPREWGQKAVKRGTAPLNAHCSLCFSLALSCKAGSDRGQTCCWWPQGIPLASRQATMHVSFAFSRPQRSAGGGQNRYKSGTRQLMRRNQ